MPYQRFNCPHCGAPGQVEYGQAHYTCTCRFNPPPQNQQRNQHSLAGCGGHHTMTSWARPAREYLMTRMPKYAAKVDA